MFIIYLIIFTLGTFIGSFLNCVIYRLENEQSFLKGRSFCPHCKHKLEPFDLIPVVSFIFLLIGIIYYFLFDYRFKGTAPLQIKIEEIKNVNYEHITFLTTYIIPLLSFDISEPRYLVLLFLLLIIIGAIYIKTNLFYANPTLALLGYHIYKITGSRNIEINKDQYINIIVITKIKMSSNDEIQLSFLSDNIYFGRKV